MVECRLDCENCRHLTVVCLHDTGPWPVISHLTKMIRMMVLLLLLLLVMVMMMMIMIVMIVVLMVMMMTTTTTTPVIKRTACISQHMGREYAADGAVYHPHVSPAALQGSRALHAGLCRHVRADDAAAVAGRRAWSRGVHAQSDDAAFHLVGQGEEELRFEGVLW